MNQFFLCFFLVFFTGELLAQDLRITCDPPDTRQDGSEYLATDTAQYDLIIDDQAPVSSDSCDFLVTLQPGAHSASVTITDIYGLTSDPAIVSHESPPESKPGVIIRITIEVLQ